MSTNSNKGNSTGLLDGGPYKCGCQKKDKPFITSDPQEWDKHRLADRENHTITGTELCAMCNTSHFFESEPFGKQLFCPKCKASLAKQFGSGGKEK